MIAFASIIFVPCRSGTIDRHELAKVITQLVQVIELSPKITPSVFCVFGPLCRVG